MDVSEAALAVQALHMLARRVEVAPDLEDFGSKCSHRRVLLRIVPLRHDDRAGNSFTLAREGDRLSMIAGRGRDDAPPVFGAQAADEIQATANLERIRRVVVLVFDVEIEARLFVQQRMAQRARRACDRPQARGEDA
jgi:hypothetical protein